MTTNDWVDPKVIVSIYAAVVSTVSLIWNIVVLINKSKSELLIKHSFVLSFFHDQLKGASPLFGQISIELTNVGNADINIKLVTLNFCGKKIELMGKLADAIECKDLQNPNKYPKLLRKGELFKDSMDVKDIINTIGDKLSDCNNLKIEVKDTLGKKYSSKKFTYKELKELLKSANDYNSKPLS